MSTMCICFNGTHETGQHLGDTLVAIKAAWLFAQNHPCDRYLLTLSPRHDMNFYWKKFIDTYKVEVLYDTFHVGNMDDRFEYWNKCYKTRMVEEHKFDHYRELYRRIDGGHRQGLLCGGERGLGRKNVFEYFFFGQENSPETVQYSQHFKADLVYHEVVPAELDVYIAPYAKCQGNAVFTFRFWDKVVRDLVKAGITVTVNFNGAFCDDLNGNPFYRKIFPGMKDLLSEVSRHRLVACGNTGVGWVAGAAGIPLLAMQPPDSHIQDYRYEWCGVRSLVEYLDMPDEDYCVKRIIEEVNKKLVFTTGCYDVLHPGHVRHLEESRSLGTRLVVALNSDESVRRRKGQGRPYNSQADREAVLRGLRAVDDVKVFDEDDALELIQELRPLVVTNGPDHKLDEIVGKAFVEQYGGEAVVTGGERAPSTTTLANKIAVRNVDVLMAIRDGSHLTVNPVSKLKLMTDHLLSVASLPGDVADLGAYRGGTSLIMKRIVPEKVIHLFDTWTGNPFYDPLCHHGVGEWAADLEEVKKAVGTDARTYFHAGIFPGSAAGINGKVFCFAYIDPDTYQTVKEAINWFWPRMTPGGKMLFDDYGWEPCSGVKKAVDEHFKDDEVEIKMEAFACIVTKKEGTSK